MDDYAGFEPQLGEITALRTFRIGPGGRLYPLYSDTAWIDGANTATCNVTVEPSEHRAPEPDCTCGYYAYGGVAGVADYPHARHVLAVIACWGKVIAGTRGIRAEHARVDALWMSDSVPGDLADLVATRYPTTAIYADQAAMLTDHPATGLDCYELDSSLPLRGRRNVAMRMAVVAALIVGLLPAGWIWRHTDARLIWAAEVCFFVAAAAILRVTRKDAKATVVCVAVTLWLIAPFAGATGTLLLRLPMLQIATLGFIQRGLLNREARRFPARIARPEH